MRAKKEEELEEVKRRAAEEAQKARLEREKRDVDVEKEDDEAKLKDQGQQVGKVRAITKEEEETKEEATEEKNDGVKTGGDYNVYILKNTMKYEAHSSDSNSIKM